MSENKLKLSPGLFVRGKKIYIRFRDPVTGKPDSKPTPFMATVRDAQRANKWKKDEDFKRRNNKLDRYVKRESSMLLSEAYELIIKQEKHLSDRTFSDYERALNAWYDFVGDKPINSYSTSDWKRFEKWMYKDKKWSQGTASFISRTLSPIFNHLIKYHQLLERNPITIIKPPKKAPKRIPKEDLKAIIQELEKAKNFVGRNTIEFMYYTGIRKNEYLKLKWNDFDFERRLFYLNNRKREGHISEDDLNDTFPISKHLEEWFLKRFPDQFDYFYKYQGKYYNNEDVSIKNGKFYILGNKVPEDEISKCVLPTSKLPNEDFCNYYKSGKFNFYERAQVRIFGSIKYTVHQLRKSFITQLFESDVPVEVVKELARHKDIKTTLENYREYQIDRYRNELDDKVDF